MDHVMFLLFRAYFITLMTVGMMASLTEFRFGRRKLLGIMAVYSAWVVGSSLALLYFGGELLLLRLFLITISAPATFLTYWAANDTPSQVVFNYMTQILLSVLAASVIRHITSVLGLSALMVTHDQNEAMAISDRILLLNNGVIEQQGTPQEMYGSPATLFAAEFMGSNNRLHGKVMALENGRARIEGASWSLWGRAGEGVSVGEPATAVIRVERLRLDGAAQDNSLQLPLLTSMYLGDRWEYLFRTEGDDFPLRAYGTALRDAEHCHLTLPAEDVWIFPQR